jgi:hypothetical protein
MGAYLTGILSSVLRIGLSLCSTTGSLLRLRPAAVLLFLVAHDPFDLAFVLLC